MHVNEVSRVRTIDRVAKDLGRTSTSSSRRYRNGARGRPLWVLSLGDESVMAFTDDGVDSLVELIKIQREMAPREER